MKSELPSCDRYHHYQRSLANQPNHAQFKDAEEESFCGPVCLQIVAQQEGLFYTSSQLTRITGTNDNGTSHYQMFSGAFEIGLCPTQVQGMEIETFAKILPHYHVIVNWMSGPNDMEDGHYSVLREVKDGMVYLSDTTISITQFKKSWYDFEEERRVDRWAIMIKKKENN